MTRSGNIKQNFELPIIKSYKLNNLKIYKIYKDIRYKMSEMLSCHNSRILSYLYMITVELIYCRHRAVSA
jgi:hypothetical protein